MVRSQRGLWSSPGGNLEFGEDPAECATRETFEETGVLVTGVEFVAITSDVLQDTGRHYITIWMRGEAADAATVIRDPDEIAEVGWFPWDAWPSPRFLYFDNLLAGRCLPRAPANLPFALRLPAS